MAPVLGDFSFIEDDDAVRVAHGGKAMRDDDRRAIFGKSRKRFPHAFLRLRIERRRRFIQNDEGRIFEKYARNRNALLLPAGEFHAALADGCIVAAGERFDKESRRRPLRRFSYFHTRRIFFSVSDIFGDAVGKKKYVLLHDTDMPPQIFLRQFPNIRAADGNFSPRGIVETKEKRNQRRFPGARFPDKGRRLPRFNRKI